jgi:hypothetical protein
MSPSWGSTPRLTGWLTDRQSQCDFDFDFEFNSARESFVRKFRRHFNNWSVNQIWFCTKQRLVSRRLRLYFVCYRYSNLQTVIIICSYDLWVSNKFITLIQNPLLLVTLARNSWDYLHRHLSLIYFFAYISACLTVWLFICFLVRIFHSLFVSLSRFN